MGRCGSAPSPHAAPPHHPSANTYRRETALVYWTCRMSSTLQHHLRKTDKKNFIINMHAWIKRKKEKKSVKYRRSVKDWDPHYSQAINYGHKPIVPLRALFQFIRSCDGPRRYRSNPESPSIHLDALHCATHFIHTRQKTAQGCSKLSWLVLRSCSKGRRWVVYEAVGRWCVRRADGRGREVAVQWVDPLPHQVPLTLSRCPPPSSPTALFCFYFLPNIFPQLCLNLEYYIIWISEMFIILGGIAWVVGKRMKIDDSLRSVQPVPFMRRGTWLHNRILSASLEHFL